MRRIIVIAVMLCLALGAFAGPAAAAKKKKKKGKRAPVTFETSGSFLFANPGDLNDMGITRNEFTQTCSIPATQGVDGFVVELPDEMSDVAANVILTGSDTTGIHDVDMYYYSAECTPMGSMSTESADEIGMFAAGTKYVVVTAFYGVQVEFDLKAEELLT